jgi:uncharacterized membrane protein
MKVSAEFQEGDKKMDIKKIIAREGLIFVGFIALIILVMTIFSDWANEHTGFQILAIFGYPIYLLIRFILWSVKTLEGKAKVSETKTYEYLKAGLYFVIFTAILLGLGAIIPPIINSAKKQFKVMVQANRIQLDNHYYAIETTETPKIPGMLYRSIYRCRDEASCKTTLKASKDKNEQDERATITYSECEKGGFYSKYFYKEPTAEQYILATYPNNEYPPVALMIRFKDLASKDDFLNKLGDIDNFIRDTAKSTFEEANQGKAKVIVYLISPEGIIEEFKN